MHEPPPAAPASDRVRVRRKPDRGRYDREALEAVLDAAFIGHVGFVVDGQPYVTPTLIWRTGDRLYWHGSPATRLARGAREGIDVCVTATIVDGFVLARSGFDHSVNYRSAMVLGRARLVDDPTEAEAALERLIEHLWPGRWAELRPITPKETKATSVLWIDLMEASVKVRADGVHDEPGDETWPVWAGVVPLRVATGVPEPDGFVPAGFPEPGYLRRLPGEGSSAG